MTAGRPNPSRDPRIDALTPREREILAEVADGKSDYEIADSLFISVNTVKTHVRHILEKLEVRSRYQAADLLTAEKSLIERWHDETFVARVGVSEPFVRRTWLALRERSMRQSARRLGIAAGIAMIVAVIALWQVAFSQDDPTVVPAATLAPAAIAQDGLPTPASWRPSYTNVENEALVVEAAMREVVVVDLSPQPISQREISVILKDASDYERAALEDGVVTVEELNAAARAAQRCTEDRLALLDGVVVRPLNESAIPFAFGGFSAPTREILDQASAAHTDCVLEYFREVASGWNAPRAMVRLVRVWAAIGTCMRAEGATVPEGADWLELRAESVAFVGNLWLFDTCAAEVSRQQL